MINGFIKTAAATPRVIIGDVDYNISQIIDFMYRANEAGVKILVFPELCITGAGCGDLFRQDQLVEAAMYGIQDILDASTNMDMLVFVGLPWRKDGRLYNVTAVVKGGSLLGIVPKLYPESSQTADECRWFESGQTVPDLIQTELMYGYDPDADNSPDDDMEPLLLPDEENRPEDASEVINGNEADKYEDDESLTTIEVPFGNNLIFECTNLNDLSIAVEIGDEYRMPCPPSVSHSLAGASIIINPAASRALAGHLRDCENEIRSISERLICAYIRAGAGPDESTTDFVFDGCRIIAEAGTVLECGKPLSKGITGTDIQFAALGALRRNSRSYLPMDEQDKEASYVYVGFLFSKVQDVPLHRKLERNPYIPAERRKSTCHEILEIQAAALAKRMGHIGSERLVLGLSGGLDSTLALLASEKAVRLLNMDPSAVICVSMPAFGTSDRTHNNSEILARCLGAEYREIDLRPSLLQHFKDIGHPADLHDAAFENAQARERTQILMDLANMVGGIVVGTGDMSEAALGWCTYNGDQMSMYTVNAGIPKSVVRMIVHTYADSSEDPDLRNVLLDILDTPVSPELLPADEKGQISQITEDIVGPYELHDFFLYYMLKYGFSPDRISWLASEAFEGDYTRLEILQWLEVFYRRFFASQFKRSCAVDGPGIFDISLSPRGMLIMPSDASGSSWVADTRILILIEQQRLADN